MLGTRRINGVQIDLFQGDITEFACDAMGNAANEELAGGGGVDGAIHKVAGPELLAACKEAGGCLTGEAKATPAFKLPAKVVLHAVGPKWHGGEDGEPQKLAKAWSRCLELAEQLECRHLAMPSISTGVYGYPVERAAGVAMQAIKSYLEQLDAETSRSLERVTIVAFDGDTHSAYQTAMFAVMPEDE